MSKRFRLSVALDVDDVLFECMPYAIKKVNEKYNANLSIHDFYRWGTFDEGDIKNKIFEFFNDEDFFRTQPVIEGAHEFIKQLTKTAEVFICTAVEPAFMSIRAKRILEEFPEIPSENIILGSRKDVVSVDILLDDGMHNIFKSNATFPILMRRPWNQRATGMLAVNNYEEFMKLLDVIRKSYSAEKDDLKDANIFVLVGPSGSGKSKIARMLLDEYGDRMEKLISYTTADKTSVYQNDWYHYITTKEFNKISDEKGFFESTMYAGHGYGSKKEDVDRIIDSGKKVLACMDICGAMALKVNYPKVVTIYIKKDRYELLTSILNKKCSNEDKVNRLISIDSEKENEAICDWSVKATNKNYNNAVKEISELMNL